MYIEPDSNIKILSGVPLDNKYSNTIYFNTKADQQAYFMELTKHNLANQSYQRVQKGVARVEIKADSLYDCNYLMFQNASFGIRWFYAFITGVEYINNAVSEITYEIDAMQTWHFDYDLKQCFVEREHSMDDTVGANLVAEPIEIGDIICESIAGSGKMDSYVAVIASAWDPTSGTEGEVGGGYFGGLFSGVSYFPALINSTSEVQNLLALINQLTSANKADSIVSIFLMPTRFFTDGAMPVVEVSKLQKNNSLSGYTPRNKKLLTYPYNYLGVDCGNNSAIYRYEYFADTIYCDFTMNSCITPNPEIQLVPKNYNGGEFNYIEKLVMTGFPQVAYSIDAYRAWLAQEASGQAIGLVGSMAGTALSVGTGNALGVGMGAIGMASSINSMMVASNKPPQAHGNNGASVSVATRTKDFYFKQMHITPQYAKIIDDFFDTYGYATCRNKHPNRFGRPHWNYVKTRDCVVTGSVPADDLKKISNAYDKGITFWKNGNDVGNYYLDNSI